MPQIYLICHAQSIADKEHIFGTDAELCFEGDAGIMSAQEIYKDIGFDRVYSSTKHRAIKTGALLFQKPLLKEHQLEVFDEIHFGEAESESKLSGTSRHASRFRNNFVKFLKDCSGDDPYERAERAIETSRNIAKLAAEFPRFYPNDKVAIITHNTLMQCIILTLRHGRNWSKITDAPHISNLDYMCLTYDKDLLQSCTLKYFLTPQIHVNIL